MFKILESVIMTTVGRMIDKLEPELEEWLLDELKTLSANVVEFVEDKFKEKKQEEEL